MLIFKAGKNAKFALQHPNIFRVLASPWTIRKTERRKFAFFMGNEKCLGTPKDGRSQIAHFEKKGNEESFEYLFHFKDKQWNVRQRKRRSSVQNERWQREEGMALWFSDVWLHWEDTQPTATAQGAEPEGPATRSKSQWSTLVFCLDSFLGKSFAIGNHLPPKRGGAKTAREHTQIWLLSLQEPTSSPKKNVANPSRATDKLCTFFVLCALPFV